MAGRIYISGPINGHDLGERRETFGSAAEELKNKGYEAINPMDMAEWGLSWVTYLALGKVMISSGDVHALFMLPGWYKSKGAILEHKWAKELGLPIFYSMKAL